MTESVKNVWDDVRSSLWFVPAVLVCAAIALAAGLIALESIYEDWDLELPWFFGAGPDGSREMLSAIASSMITVAGVTFSITVVSLSLASGQFTPRILRNFMRDRVNQSVLGIFVGIFTYCLIVLRSIRSGDDSEFVPSIAVLVGIVLALVGIGVLVLFIHHTATAIQASEIISSISEETLGAIDRIYPNEAPHTDEPPLKHSAGDWRPIPAKFTGHIRGVNREAFNQFAYSHALIVRMGYGVGDFVIRDLPIVEISKEPWAPSSPEEDKIITDSVNGFFTIGEYRLTDRDPLFGIRQLVDIALKALSPGINDSTTAATCVDYLTVILAHVARRDLATMPEFDGDRQRIIRKDPGFPEFVALALNEIRSNAAGNVAIHQHLLTALDKLDAITVASQRRQVLQEHAQRIEESAGRTISSPADRDQLQRSARRIAATFGYACLHEVRLS